MVLEQSPLASAQNVDICNIVINIDNITIQFTEWPKTSDLVKLAEFSMWWLVIVISGIVLFNTICTWCMTM